MQLLVLGFKSDILRGERSFLLAKVGMQVCSISYLSLEVDLGHHPSCPEPATAGLHLHKFISILQVAHSQDLAFDIVIEEFIPLHHQMILDGRVFSNLVSTFVQVLGCSNGQLRDGFDGQTPQLGGQVLWSTLPLLKGSLHVSLARFYRVLAAIELELQ